MLLACTLFLLVVPLVLATERPIIGILAQEVVKQDSYPEYSSLIAASYVKAVEQSGARVVPIFINRTEQYYKNILNNINGVVLPGGGVNFTNVGGYADAGRSIVNHAKQINSENRNFPILGVCLGFELLVYLDVNSYEILAQCNATKINLPLKFTQHFRNSRLYGDAPQEIINILRTESVTYNNHKKCVTEELLNEYNVVDKWHILSTNVYSEGAAFVSSAEYHNLPFVGVIFHPEKNAYEWSSKYNFTHSKNALIASRYFYDWLVQEARKNNHRFNATEEEDRALIYNYNATYVNGYYEQLYFFKDILNNINGVVLPGGGVNFTNVGGYADAGRSIVNHAKQGALALNYLLVYLDVNSYEILAQCNATKINLPLKFTQHFRNSRLYGDAPQEIINILRTESVTYNNHKKCVTEELLNEYNVVDKWHILSTNVYSEGAAFVSSAEYHNLPFVGVIFHPEKNAYEWSSKYNFTHSKNALIASRYFYDWLVQEARKNNHRFNATEEEDRALIYNYNATYVNGYYEQLYFFK